MEPSLIKVNPETSVSTVSVTVTTRVYDARGNCSTEIRLESGSHGGNPGFVTKQAHDATEAVSARTREMLKTIYGEVDAAWET